MPDHWESYLVHYRYRETLYHITIKRVGKKPERVIRVTLDDAVVYEADRDDAGRQPGIVPLADDRQEHYVEVAMGPAVQGRS
jgi:cyclic beta-1,2-glucan synthetase